MFVQPPPCLRLSMALSARDLVRVVATCKRVFTIAIVWNKWCIVWIHIWSTHNLTSKNSHVHTKMITIALWNECCLKLSESSWNYFCTGTYACVEMSESVLHAPSLRLRNSSPWKTSTPPPCVGFTCIYINICVSTHMHIHAHTRTLNTLTCTCTQIDTHMHTYICTHVHFLMA